MKFIKRRVILALSVLLLLLTLTGCGCKHEWTQANCTTPKTCSICGKTKGARNKNNHDWLDPTCTAPLTCSRCNETQGKPFGHKLSEATCTEAQICSVCGEVVGEPLGHDWQAASCVDPRTCVRCGETDGESLGHTAVLMEDGLINCVNAKITFDKVCSVCGEKIGEKTDDITSFIDEDHFLFTADDFRIRANQNSTKETSIEYKIVKSNGNIQVDGIDGSTRNVTVLFFNNNVENIQDESASDIAGMQITLLNNNSSTVMQIMSYISLFEPEVFRVLNAIDPQMTRDDANEILSYVAVVGSYQLNGINYSGGYNKDASLFTINVMIK